MPYNMPGGTYNSGYGAGYNSNGTVKAIGTGGASASVKGGVYSKPTSYGSASGGVASGGSVSNTRPSGFGSALGSLGAASQASGSSLGRTGAATQASGSSVGRGGAVGNAAGTSLARGITGLMGGGGVQPYGGGVARRPGGMASGGIASPLGSLGAGMANPVAHAGFVRDMMGMNQPASPDQRNMSPMSRLDLLSRYMQNSQFNTDMTPIAGAFGQIDRTGSPYGFSGGIGLAKQFTDRVPQGKLYNDRVPGMTPGPMAAAISPQSSMATRMASAVLGQAPQMVGNQTAYTPGATTAYPSPAGMRMADPFAGNRTVANREMVETPYTVPVTPQMAAYLNPTGMLGGRGVQPYGGGVAAPGQNSASPVYSDPPAMADAGAETYSDTPEGGTWPGMLGAAKDGAMQLANYVSENVIDPVQQGVDSIGGLKNAGLVASLANMFGGLGGPGPVGRGPMLDISGDGQRHKDLKAAPEEEKKPRDKDRNKPKPKPVRWAYPRMERVPYTVIG